MIVIRFFLIAITILMPMNVSEHRPVSVPDVEIDQIFGHLDRNFAVIDSEVGKRGARLSPVFLENLNGIRDIVQQRRDQKTQFSNQTNANLSGSPGRERYVEELKAIDIDTTGMASFLQAAPASEDGETKVRFDTQFQYKSNSGWWVCWISYGRKSQPPFCYPQFSTPVPNSTENPQPFAAGCKYVVTVIDPKEPNTPHNPFPSGFIEVAGSDREYPIPIPVPHEIKKEETAKEVKKKKP